MTPKRMTANYVGQKYLIYCYLLVTGCSVKIFLVELNSQFHVTRGLFRKFFQHSQVLCNFQFDYFTG
jgi:hypothetical protein